VQKVEAEEAERTEQTLTVGCSRKIFRKKTVNSTTHVAYKQVRDMKLMLVCIHVANDVTGNATAKMESADALQIDSIE
jgi:hypothetical protein